MSGELNPSEQTKNERMAMGMMYMIARAEDEYKSKKGSGACGTLEDLVAANLIPKEFLGRSGYRFDVMPNGDKFEISAVPLDYGKSGVMSFFMDHGRVLRGGDRNGAPATASDPPIR